MTENRFKFSDRAIRDLQPAEQETAYWDESFPGSFGLRVSPKGKKTFMVLYRYRNRFRRKSLGSYPITSLSEARKKAAETLNQLQAGNNPDRQTEEANLTFEELGERYLKEYAELKKSSRSIAEDQRILRTYLNPAWSQWVATDIPRSDVIRLLDRIVFERKAPVMANRVLALISVMFNFAIKKELVPEDHPNPCRNIDPPGKEKSRDRVLNDKEIKILWKVLEDREEPLASLYRLILLTAQRGGEVKGMRWDEIEEDTWTIPAEKTKNKREHKVPLPVQAIAVLERLRQISDEEEYVFPSPTGGHIRWLRRSNKAVQEACKFHFTPHDLRRTASTNMSKLGTEDVLIAKILNHTWADRQIPSVYNRWHRLPDMRGALQRWADHLEKIITDKSVKK